MSLGEGADIICPGILQDGADIYWYMEDYTESLASYNFYNNSIHLTAEYVVRGVTLTPTDGQLHLPEVLLSDEARYICSVEDGVYENVTVHVHGE